MVIETIYVLILPDIELVELVADMFKPVVVDRANVFGSVPFGSGDVGVVVALIVGAVRKK